MLLMCVCVFFVNLGQLVDAGFFLCFFFSWLF